MLKQHQQFLQEMGIQSYELTHPERLEGFQYPKITLPSSCKLLLISPTIPEMGTAHMFERVLKTIDLTLEQTLHIFPEQCNLIEQAQLDWIWYAGSHINLNIEAKVLNTPLLEEIDGNNDQRRALWQQICSYR